MMEQTRRGFLRFLGLAASVPLAAKTLPLADWIMPKFQTMQQESYVWSSKALVDELRERAQAVTFYQQMALSLSIYGEHARVDRLLFDKIGRVTSVDNEGVIESRFPWTNCSIGIKL